MQSRTPDKDDQNEIVQIDQELETNDTDSESDGSKDDTVQEDIEDTTLGDDVMGKRNLDIDETRRGQILASIHKTMKKLKSSKQKCAREMGKVSIWDFGGQFVFYSTHQIFLSARAIYIIVLDISKELTEKVTDECFLDSAGVQFSTIQGIFMF